MDFGTVINNARISIYNYLGQRLIEKKYESTDQIQIDLSHFYSGIYFINVYSEGKSLGNYKIIRD